MTSPGRSSLAAILVLLAAHSPRRAAADGYTISTVASFNVTNGSSPTAGVTLDSQGNLYGTTNNGGGASNDGTVFQIAAGSNAVTTLVTFTGANGINPQGGLTTDSQGNLFGTTRYGGANSAGTIFEVAAGSHSFSTIASFDGTNGNQPVPAPTIDSHGNLYGTTYYGGSGYGNVYEVAAGTGSISTLATFNGSSTGANPGSGLTMDSHGNLFGTTNAGGANSDGIVYEVAAGTHALSTVATFNGANGSVPFGTLTMDAAGNLYGTTAQGGANGYGTVFEIAAGTNTIVTLATFNSTNGAYPEAGLTLDAAGNIFGTTFSGGVGNDGTVFEIAAGTRSFSTLITFNGTNGTAPEGVLVLDSQGDIFGTTQGGGASGHGTVFELSPASAVPGPASLLALVQGGVLAGLGILARAKARA